MNYLFDPFKKIHSEQKIKNLLKIVHFFGGQPKKKLRKMYLKSMLSFSYPRLQNVNKIGEEFCPL